MKTFWGNYSKFFKGLGVGMFLTMIAGQYYIETYVEVTDVVWSNAHHFCSDKGGIHMLKHVGSAIRVWCDDYLKEKKK